MTNAQDFGALNWVKDELDVSIRQARQELEAYVEANGDGSALVSCGDHLHQIARVLQMVQVYGPSMLAEEMELVVRDMVAGAVRQQDDAAEALMLALIQLPDYLEKLQGGEADIPLIILPLLNDLRAVRDAPLLSEAALFKPEIEGAHVSARITGEANEALPALVKTVRQKLHVCLLYWYRRRDTEHAWPRLQEIFDKVQKSAGTEQVHRLFWVASALMQGLMEGVIAPGIAVKQLFSRIDRKMKQIIDGGEHAIRPEETAALLKNLLYYIARAKSESALIRQVKDAYNLDQVLPSEDQLAQGRLGLSGSNAELAESIRDAVSVELTRIKDILDLFMRDDKADMAMLGHLESPIHKLADTLGMIGQGALRSRLNRQANKVRGFVEKGSMPEEFELMEMAGDILFVESSLSTLHTAHTLDDNAAEEGGWSLNLPEGEYQNLVKQTVREAKVDIAKAKEVIIDYSEASNDASVLYSVREGFKRVEGALRMLNLLEAAEVMAKTGGFIQFRLIESSVPPQRHQLNYLADVVSSIEYYLETLVDGAGDRREILAIAGASLSNLLNEGAEVTPYFEPAEVIDLAGPGERSEDIEREEEILPDLEFGESSLHLDETKGSEIETIEDMPLAEPEIQAEQLQIETSATQAALPDEEQRQTASMDKPALEDIDSEILEIFIEEAREELQSILQSFPQWRQNQEDHDALVTLRRSFHTLKGSGRLVGAKTIGELAWSIENMLNRMIDETIQASPQMMSLLDKVISALPELIDCQEREVSPEVNVAQLEREAHAIAEGKPLQVEEPLEEEALPQAHEILEIELDEDLAALELPAQETPEHERLEITPSYSSTERDESETMIEMELPSDFAEEMLEFEVPEESPVEQGKGARAAYSDSELEIEFDTELLGIFAEESEAHLQEIEAFLQIARGSEAAVLVPEEVVRASHTLRGSANMAGIMAIAQLAETMESYAKALHEQRQFADEQVIELLSDCVACFRQLLGWLKNNSLPEPPVEFILRRLHLALDNLGVPGALGALDDITELEPPRQAEIEAASEAEDEAEVATAESAEVEEVEFLAEAEPALEAEIEAVQDQESPPPWDLDEVSDNIDLTVSSFGLESEITDVSDSLELQKEGELFELGDDQELIEIFVEEARELLETLDQDYQTWCAEPRNRSVQDDIKRVLHTLKGSSRLAGITPVGDLSHALETLFMRLGGGDVVVSEPLRNLVREVLDQLASLTEQAASEGRVASVDELLAALNKSTTQQLAEQPEDDTIDLLLQEELAAAEAMTETPESPSSQTVTDFYDEPLSFVQEGDLFHIDGDPELVEIFIEESRELLGVLEESYSAWLANPADQASIDRLQRSLHTLKGSSRLAGVMPVGDLSHALESLLAAVSVGTLAASPAVVRATREALDLLATQTEAAESSYGIPQSAMLIAHLEGLHSEPALDQPEAIDPHLQQALDESALQIQESAVESATGESVSDEDDHLSLPDESVLAIDDSEPATDEEAGESFIIMEENALLDVSDDDELVKIFVEESKEFVERIESHFQQWMEQPEDRSLIEGVQRNLHTLKGSARLAGIMPIGNLSHAVESLMTAIAEEEIDPVPLVTDTARQAIDHLAHQVEMIGSTGKVPGSDELVANLRALLGGETEGSVSNLVEAIQIKSDSESVETVPEAPEQQATAQTVLLDRDLDELLGTKKQTEKESYKRSKEQVRVSSDLMDRLVNHAGEVSIYRSRLEQQNSVLRFNLAELKQTVSRLYAQLRSLEIETEAQILYRWDREHEKDDKEKTEFDPLEMDRFSTIQQLSRALAETVNDLGNINEFLTDLQRETETLLLQQSRISTDLQDGLLRTRMVPFAQLVPRLQRLVRQTAGQLNKKANLECFGIEGELDRGILNRMVPVLEHLMRNSVSHGIEFPAEREQAGKQVTGRISLYLDREANDVLITLSDDGKGLDIEAIRRRAVEQGMIDANVEVSDDDLIQCVLIPGFSTAKEVTQISGRGVGLDVVTSEVKQLGGSLEIDSQPGRGTSFIIRLPLTLAITNALLMRVGEEVYAIPHGSIEGVVRMRRKELLACYAGEQNGYNYAGRTYKLDYLGRMMGTGQHEIPDAARWMPLLLLQTGEHQVALQVDELLGTRQVVVKSLGKQVGSVRWITGGTILADGRVALILDLAALVRMDATHAAGGLAMPIAERKRAEERLRVMVVDDSITVRKVTSRLLERNDMDVITAKDGVEAVALLQEQVPDIMLLDIEMPRMDGFELARHINNSVDYYGLPIIMISSRVGEKHRQRAYDLGVKRCLGKPYQEAELLDNINEVLAESRQ